MALAANAIIQAVATLQAIPGLSGLTTGQAEALIHRASAAIRKYTGRRLLIDTQADVTVYEHGNGAKDLFCSEGPITVLTTAKVDTDRTFDSGSELSLDDIAIMGGDRGSSYKDDGEDFPTVIRSLATTKWSKGFKNVQLVGRFGYNDDTDRYPIPEDLIYACCLLCKHYHLHTDASMKSERTQTYSYTKGGAGDYRNGLPNEIAATLDPYRVMRIH